ncbi:MAG TPA: hypothetical protein VE983_06205 [Solirubrobacteraceae bacterium]|nr:hypothetical protein [Solirubrobacteraceae bacterium]
MRPNLSRSPKRDVSSRRRLLLPLGGAVLLETVCLWLRSGRLAGRVIVRCRRGHLFTTIWIPAVSVKSLRLGFWRAQRCPIGPHWSLVTPVRASALSDGDRRSAAQHHDIHIP